MKQTIMALTPTGRTWSLPVEVFVWLGGIVLKTLLPDWRFTQELLSDEAIEYFAGLSGGGGRGGGEFGESGGADGEIAETRVGG